MSQREVELSGRERPRISVNGQDLDRPLVSLWRHFPEEDQTAEGLADATLRSQDSFGFDFIKFMPPGDYPTIDWGAESRFEGSPGGTRTTATFPVNGAGWQDRRFEPAQSDIRSRSGRCIAGGIDEQPIVTNTSHTVAESAIDAIEQNGARSVIVASGCVIPVSTPMQNVTSAVNAVKSWSQI
jgi:hypothetical protein